MIDFGRYPSSPPPPPPPLPSSSSFKSSDIGRELIFIFFYNILVRKKLNHIKIAPLKIILNIYE